MVAALFAVNHDLALVATFPAFFLRLLQESLQVLVLRALRRRMPNAIAVNTNLGTTSTLGPGTTLVHLDHRWMNPISAPLVGTVEAIISGVFFVLAVPLLLEFDVEFVFDVTE